MSDDWLTPPEIIEQLGPFDLDPAASIEHPDWTRCERVHTLEDDGLAHDWSGRVWLNPPYTEVETWLRRMAEHGHGTALIFARTETRWWFESIWPAATAMLFLRGRLTFYTQAGVPSKAGHSSGGPSVLIAYGEYDADRLECSDLGAFTRGWRVLP